ncbi:NADP-dependent malate dehydrogenase [Chlorella sorokiniana]|uniref:Malic enzyme n=1 Tax=Chlorella sorokiniana TaxID=3076 RepID=A0A2P6THW9_CHLSO|nr:NADP-dependent malate dehydrogenase [Chlorella sorokiniana]|eukprot:PRW33894.1 NADP-dependent malate dehydrogenase [Chlorella sorokiniana]
MSLHHASLHHDQRNESASDLHARDVAVPGLWQQRKREIKTVEEQAGAPVIWASWLNRGTNFGREEREHLHIEGLLPPVVESLELQAERVMCQLRETHNTDLQRYSILNELLSSNQCLYYKVLTDNLEELAPIVYTPTVGEACQKFDRIYRTPLGLYLSAFHHRGRFEQVLGNWPSHNVQIIVVTDGSRILGLGDLGTNGIGISIGKVALYVAGGGFHPEHSLPVVLDVGCNRPELVGDKFYLGERRPRLEGDEYYGVIDEFCKAVKALWPHALLQFEDFETTKAFEILHRQRDKLLCFNDDIQGTGAVVTSGFINGMKYQKTPLSEARIVFYGAGSSAVGVAEMIATYMQQKAGISWGEARKRIYMVDSKGLITFTRGDTLPDHKKHFARDDGTPDMKDLKDIIAYVKPHALIGLSAAGPSWFQDTVEELCKHTPCPLIFPLSNPTSKAEITAQQAYEWSKGSCVFASGSPFAPVTLDGTTYVPGQANNVFIFPGVGFGSVMAKATKVTDQMFVAASQALADAVSEEQLGRKEMYPEITQLRAVSCKVAAAVAQAAFECGVSELVNAPEDWHEYISTRMFVPMGRTTKTAGMPVSKSTAQLSYVYSGEELASAAATAAAKSRFHPAHHPSGLPVHP